MSKLSVSVVFVLYQLTLVSLNRGRTRRRFLFDLLVQYWIAICRPTPPPSFASVRPFNLQALPFCTFTHQLFFPILGRPTRVAIFGQFKVLDWYFHCLYMPRCQPLCFLRSLELSRRAVVLPSLSFDRYRIC